MVGSVYHDVEGSFIPKEAFLLDFILMQKIDQAQGKAIYASARVLCIHRDFLSDGKPSFNRVNMYSFVFFRNGPSK